jgi:hypothetical protein
LYQESFALYSRREVNRYNLAMRLPTALVALVLLAASALAQRSSNVEGALKSVTVPVTLDHDRVVVDVSIPLPDGSTKRVRGWVDNGDPDIWMSQRAAGLMGLTVSCDGQVCSGTPNSRVLSLEVLIGGMKVFLSPMRDVKVPASDSGMVPGMSAEIKIPSSVLRNYDVLINYPDREFSIGLPGILQFKGVKTKVIVNTQNGLIQVPSQIENKKYNLALDIGSSISFLSDELFDKLAAANLDWPHMTGAVGPANLWGLDDEPKRKLMRLNRVQYGPLYLTDVAVVDFPKDRIEYFERRAGVSTAGLLGASALMNYRIGLDYAHSTVYFDLGRTFKFPEFDVVGLILRPEADTRFTILGVADIDGEPSVPTGDDGVRAGDHLVAVGEIPAAGSTMGQVWSLLEGTPGQERKLTIERDGKQLTVIAKVQHFLAESEESHAKQKSGRKN